MSPSSNAAYKGKFTHRWWPQLPEELVRLIATNYLWDLSATSYCPKQWETRDQWYPRMVYTILRDAAEIEAKFMQICPQWSLAVETHLFWQQAISLIDPHDSLAHIAVLRSNPNSTQPPITLRLTPYRHFRNLSIYSCFVCRINWPATNQGLASAKRTVHTSFLGAIPVCRDHNRKGSFCGLCLREADVHQDSLLVSCLENEDEESWPGIETTCRSCRAEWLWRRASANPTDRDAIGGHKFNSPDWETRQTVDGFIDLAEGTISDVISLAQEKHWLRCYTKLPELMSQALAASRYAGYENEAGDDDDLTLSEEEEDTDLMQMTEESGGVRDLALADWARTRIINGFWLNPADQWYGNTIPNQPRSVPAVHPCPWTVDEYGDNYHEQHPSEAIVSAAHPPSFALCEQAYQAFQRQLRLILLPAMKNIVRKLVIECSSDGIDPAVKAARMTHEDVIIELRDEAVWFEGIDWLEKRRNERRDQEETRLRQAREEGSDDSSSSTRSDGSHTTSPVLSTTTLQTTPSPPPLDKDDIETVPTPITIAVAPVLNPPRLLRPIPHVPVTLSNLPQYSFDAFKTVWREACAPLYHCRCRICERAQCRANADANHTTTVPSQQPVAPAPTSVPQRKPREIKLQTWVNPVREPVQASEEESGNESDVADNGSSSDGDDESNPPSRRSRKRSIELLDDYDGSEDDADAEGDLDEDYPKHSRVRLRKAPQRVLRLLVHSHPSKKARKDEDRETPVPCSKWGASPGRLRKRGSEELDDEDLPNDRVINGTACPGNGNGIKRARVSVEPPGEGQSPPTSLTGSLNDELSSTHSPTPEKRDEIRS
ncbi:hypothetical protein ONZ45_g13396 [Pleurotus djamor]|nr:hypothetical protein ONZ45_g13396 [Pleurotus djamor]